MAIEKRLHISVGAGYDILIGKGLLRHSLGKNAVVEQIGQVIAQLQHVLMGLASPLVDHNDEMPSKTLGGISGDSRRNYQEKGTKAQDIFFHITRL